MVAAWRCKRVAGRSRVELVKTRRLSRARIFEIMSQSRVVKQKVIRYKPPISASPPASTGTDAGYGIVLVHCMPERLPG